MFYEIKLLQPARDFITSLELKLRAKTFRTIDLLKEFGPFLKEPHSKKIIGVEGLYELRVKQGNNICRLFYFHFRDKVYIITSGYVKKDMKTDQNQIKHAKDLMKEMLEELNG
jgi:phage-related protein